MQTDVQKAPERHPSIVRRGVAGLVLLAAAALAIKLLAGVVIAVLSIVAAIAVIVAVIWALKTIF